MTRRCDFDALCHQSVTCVTNHDLSWIPENSESGNEADPVHALNEEACLLPAFIPLILCFLPDGCCVSAIFTNTEEALRG